MFRWFLMVPSRPSRKTLWNWMHNRAVLTRFKCPSADFSAAPSSRGSLFFYCEPEKYICFLQDPCCWRSESWSAHDDCVYYVSVHPVRADMNETSRNSPTYPRTSITFSGPWCWLLASMEHVCHTAEYKVGRNMTDFTLMAHYLKLCCLSVQLAIGMRRVNKEIHPQTYQVVSFAFLFCFPSPCFLMFPKCFLSLNPVR